MKLFGIIYMTPRRIQLSIIDLKKLTKVENVFSNTFSNKNYQYDQSVEEIAGAINGYLQLAKDYGVKNVKLWGNQQQLDTIRARYLGEQLYIRTGLHIKWLSTSQLTYYKATAVKVHLDNFEKLSLTSTYLLSLGIERASLSQFDEQKFISTWNIDLGSSHIGEISAAMKLSASDSVEVIEDYIGSKLEHLHHVFSKKKESSNLVLQDAYVLAQKFIPAGKTSYTMNVEDFKKLYATVIKSSDQYLMNFFDLDENEIGRIIPYFILIEKIIKLIAAKKVIITNIAVSDGLAIERATRTGLMSIDLNGMILTSAENLASRYLTSHAHRQNVSKLALHLFDQLKRIHHLGKRERLLLNIACIVDDIGNYINQQQHYRHSAYILEATRLIGLSNDENQIIAEVSRYHSSETPETDQPHFQKLEPTVQMSVAKLAAILRLADALDDAREQKIKKISVSLRGSTMFIYAYSNQNIALEAWSFNNKSALFKEVFGIDPILKQRRQQK
ncbi:hypothetical protein [Liquorilactobacillus sucicola]|nr:hypothetical protein [Liquorilactobacillus sucicola]